MSGTPPQRESSGVSEPTAVKVEDPKDLRPDFFQTTKAGGERQRLALACQTCRQKKVKCNGELPKCHRCTNLNLECEYKLTTHRRSRNPSTSKKPRHSSTDDGSTTQGQDGEAPGEKWQTDKKTKSPPTKRAKTETFSVPPTSSYQLPNNVDHIEGNQQSSAVSRVGTPSSRQSVEYPATQPVSYMNTDCSRGGPRATPVWSDPSIRFELPAPLPSHKLLIELCQIYFSRIYGQMYCFLHPPSFMRDVVERPLSINSALLLAICALSARFHATAKSDVLQSDLWASTCLDKVFGINSHHKDHSQTTSANSVLRSFERKSLFQPSITSIQALHLIAYHYFGQGQSTVAWLISGFGIRMAEALHLNRELYDDPIGQPQNQPVGHIVTFKDREIRRRTYWALYIMDRMNSAGVRRPFSIRNEEVAIQLPVTQESFDREIPSYTCLLNDQFNNSPEQMNLAASMDCSAYMIKIIDVWGEVSRFVQQSASALNWNTGSPFLALRQQILAWEASLPHSMRYVNGNAQMPAWYIMHTAYFLSLCVMHRFALPKSGTKQYGVDHIPVGYLQMCVKEAIHNAARVSEIVQSIPSNMQISAPFMGFAAFSAATLHAFLGFHVPDMDSTSIAMHRGFVNSTLTFLGTLAEAWKPLSKMHDALTSQVNNRPRTNLSHRSSILNESCAAERFKVPESLPVKFSTQQQIEMNTLAFSNWFDDPLTSAKLDPAWARAQRYGWSQHEAPQFSNNMPYVASYDSRTGTIMQEPDRFQPPASNGDLERQQTRLRPKDASNAPYGEAFPIVDSEENEDDSVVADLLVSFKQSEYPGGPRRVSKKQAQKKKSSRSDQGGHLNGTVSPYDDEEQNNNHNIDGDHTQQVTHGAGDASYLDRLDSLRETSDTSATIDCLQLMKVGLITARHWA